MLTRRHALASLTLLVGGSATANQALDQPYSPTRGEWLRFSLLSAIIERSSVWRRRLGVTVAIFEKEAKVVVVITVANGEPEPTRNAKENYIGDVRSICRSVMAQYGWAKALNLEVTMV